MNCQVSLGERATDSDKLHVLEWAAGSTPAKAPRLSWSRVEQTTGVPPYPSFHPTAVFGHSTTLLPRGHRGGGEAVGGGGGGLLVLGGCTDPHPSQRDRAPPLSAQLLSASQPLLSLGLAALSGFVLDGKRLCWHKLATGGTPPYARYSHSSTLLPANPPPTVPGAEPSKDDGVLVVVGGHCRGTCHRDVFVLDFGASPPAWRQLRPENGAPALSGHTATVLRAPGAAQDEGVILFLGGEEGLLCLENVSVRSLRAWSADATARAIDLRPSAAEEEHSAGGEDAGSAEWQAALRRLDELEVVTAEDIPKLPAAPEADAQILGLPSQPSAPKDAAEEAAAAAARKKAFRRAILTWHPDVMMRRLGGRLAADGYDAAYAVVTSNSIRVLEAAERLGAA